MIEFRSFVKFFSGDLLPLGMSESDVTRTQKSDRSESLEETGISKEMSHIGFKARQDMKIQRIALMDDLEGDVRGKQWAEHVEQNLGGGDGPDHDVG